MLPLRGIANEFSSDSSGASDVRRWKKKQLKFNSQKPFKLRTEQRGKHKEEVFVKKVQEMLTEEDKQRIPIAQGRPRATAEPEPPVKDITRPIDLKLHSDVRAVERADFDTQVAEKLSLLEQHRMEKR
ncbi:protein TPX2-like [Papaver somniferum]|uniref:protein TPX2-like n=1 Tax=Papaver somniferum TaxID=3469 RepID=UPI000E6FCFC8|nr:protein TPX2-like [Papaver somniferum]XP_026456160.1 protein TPX2-like [Papaver somniferum]